MGRQKPSKIWRDFGRLRTSIANISGMDEDVDKRKSALSNAISPTFDFVNSIPTELTRLMFTNQINFLGGHISAL